jgi:hypothetical protein
MLETNYTLNLGQLLKMTPKLKKYLWQIMKLDKPWNVTKVVIEKILSSVVLKVATTIIAIDNHMVVI